MTASRGIPPPPFPTRSSGRERGSWWYCSGRQPAGSPATPPSSSPSNPEPPPNRGVDARGIRVVIAVVAGRMSYRLSRAVRQGSFDAVRALGCRIERSLAAWIRARPREGWTATMFRWASYLTEPVCRSHERYRRICLVDTVHPGGSRLANLARKVRLFTELLGHAGLASLTTVPGIALRHAAASWQARPYLCTRSPSPGKTLPADRAFSILSWNVCCVGGGYPVSGGGVLPSPARVED